MNIVLSMALSTLTWVGAGVGAQDTPDNPAGAADEARPDAASEQDDDLKPSGTAARPADGSAEADDAPGPTKTPDPSPAEGPAGTPGAVPAQASSRPSGPKAKTSPGTAAMSPAASMPDRAPGKPAATKVSPANPERPLTLEEASPADIRRDEQGEFILVPDPLPPPLSIAPGADVEAMAERLSTTVVRLYVDRGETTVSEAVGFFVAHDRLVVPRALLLGSKGAAYQRAGHGDRIGIAGVLGDDPAAGLATVKLSSPVPVPPLGARPRAPRLGERVFVVGVNTGGHPVLWETRIAQSAGELRIALALPPTFAGSPVVDAQGRLVGVVKHTFDEQATLSGLVPASSAAAVAMTPAALLDVGAFARKARAASDEEPMFAAGELTAGGIFVTTASCLSSCGLLACGIPVVGGVGVFAVVGCLSGVAIVLSGGSLLVQLLQILSVPMGMSTVVGGLAAGSLAGALLLLGASSAAAGTAMAAAPAGFALAVLGGREAVLPEPPLAERERSAMSF